MNATLFIALGAFGAALIFAIVLTGWRQRLQAAMDAVQPAPTDGPLPTMALLVPVRNGAETLMPLLQDLYEHGLEPARCEVIVIDDHSTDAVRSVVEGFVRQWPQLRYMPNAGVGKKAAITTGVNSTRAEVILMTDADARCAPGRARFVAERFVLHRWDMLLLPVVTEGGSSPVEWIQAEEQAALLGVGAATALGGSPVLANGANMAFRREAFLRVRGYEGDDRASGDDVFLLSRMRRAGLAVRYALDRSGAVTVGAEHTCRGFWQQRLRWAGKMRAVAGVSAWWSAGAMLFPWMLLCATIAIDWSQAVHHGFIRAALLVGSAWVLWLFPVLGLVAVAKRFMQRTPTPLRSALAAVLFSVYAPVVALVALFVRPEWKGRSI